MKRFLLLLAALLPLLTHAYDFEAKNSDGVTIYYNKTSATTAQVTYRGKESIFDFRYSGSVNIPSQVTYNDVTYTVNSIGDWAFYQCSGLTSITLPNSVTSIGDHAFSYCSGLTRVTIPESVTSISESAFSSCFGLTSVSIPNSVTSIGESAFFGCSGLTSLTIPNSVTSISDWAFSDCSGLTSIDIPSSVTSIGSRAFGRCSGLTSIDIPSSVTSIGSRAFGRCTGLTSVTIPGSVTSIDSEAFYGCTNLISGDIRHSTTQTSITLKIKPNDNASVGITPAIQIMGVQKDLEFGRESELFFSHLTPNTSYNYNPGFIHNGRFYYISSEVITTQGFVLNVNSSSSATSVTLSGRYSVGDATLESSGWAEYPGSSDVFKITGLAPGSEHTFTYRVTASGVTETKSVTVKTQQLTLSTLPGQALNTTTALLCAETNLDDDEVNVGFEWRRYDAPSTLPSNKVVCAVVDGSLQGALNRLNPDVYYNYRPYYTADNGTTYYGQWITFFTGDASVYFDPTVRTYNAHVLGSYSAQLKGYALQGSSDIASQGFQYWPESGKSTHSATSADGVTEIEAAGYKISTTLNDLEPGTTYSYRAYVRDTAGNYTYGETMQFTTEPLAGIESVPTSADGCIEFRGSLSHGTLQMLVCSQESHARWQIVDMSGRPVACGAVTADGEWHPIEAALPASGFYILVARTPTMQRTLKIAIK